MDCSMSGFPVLHQFLELAQTYVHRLGDAIQSFHPVFPFSSCLQYFPESGSLPMSQFFTSDGQGIEASESAPVPPMYIQDWFPLGWTGLISLQSKGLSRVFSSTTVQKHQFFSSQPFFIVQLSHLYMTTGKIIALTRQTFVGKVMCLLFNMLSRLVTAFLPKSKCLLTSWLEFNFTVVLEGRIRTTGRTVKIFAQ